MCTTCGCTAADTRIDGAPIGADGTRAEGDVHEHVHADGSVQVHSHAHQHAHTHDAWRPFGAVHAPGMTPTRIVQVEQDILARNNACAADNRRRFADRGVFALNLVSSPGSGKTCLLVRTIEAWRQRTPVAVIEGDQQTSLDADRIRATGAPSVQINTGKGCHLDAQMVGRALDTLQPAENSLLFIENVGNLVCPAAFDLGEAHKVVLLSVTEGEDKPLKYPDMFAAAELMLINKSDLLPHVRFDVGAAIAHAQRIRPGMQAMLVSAETGEGLDGWLAWLERGVDAACTGRTQSIDALQRRVTELETMLAARPESGGPESAAATREA